MDPDGPTTRGLPTSERLAPADTRPVRASAVLSAEAKLVWMEDWELDRGGEGCWLSHAQLGERIGLTGHAVQYHRTKLEGLGLYERLKRAGARTPGWRPVVPEQCHVRSQRPTPIEVAAARTFLDLALRGRGPPGRLHTPADQTPRTRQPDSQSLPVRISEVLSTAFDSQAEKQPSTALGVEGNRVSARAPEAKAVEDGGMRRGVLPRSADLGAELETESRDPLPSERRAMADQNRAEAAEVERRGWEALRAKRDEKRRQMGLG